MPLITLSDLDTHLYAEVISEITRDNEAIANEAIAVAEQEAKLYLGRYDLNALFGTEEAAPTLQDVFLKSIVKDIACWHLLRLANTGTDYQAAHAVYVEAIATLKAIMEGNMEPQWPYAAPIDDSAIPDNTAIYWSSNNRRENFY